MNPTASTGGSSVAVARADLSGDAGARTPAKSNTPGLFLPDVPASAAPVDPMSAKPVEKAPACKDNALTSAVPTHDSSPAVGPEPLGKDDKGPLLTALGSECGDTCSKVAAHCTAPSVRMVNSKRIQFNYELKDVGPSGVATVELWYTADGHAWQKYEGGNLSGPPAVAEVPEEGTYGFTLVARNSTGHGKEPPKPGDLPQVWVEVDLTAPKVTLNEVKPGVGAEAHTLHIAWSAKDRNLARRPITLSYAEHATGPWTVIAANQENTGKYDWTMPAGLPGKVHVRVEACDLVGNVGMAQSHEPVACDMAVPSVSIVDVAPAAK
jgi:hypothetical protein